MGLQITGVKELQRALNALPKELQRTAERGALRGGMEPVKKSAAANLNRSTDTGLLKKSLGLNVRKLRSGQLSARVGPRGGFRVTNGVYTRGKNKGKPIYQDPRKYAHLVEYGTSHSAAQPFIRPAIESNSSQIIAGLAKGYNKGFARAVKKARSNK